MLVRLGELGFSVVDTDQPGWTEWSDDQGGYVWREERISRLLEADCNTPLFVSGAVSNQGRFYRHFDEIVLLSLPVEVLLRRIATRTTNSFGRTAVEREAILRDLAEVEPLLRRSCTLEIDATRPLGEIVDQLAELVR